MRHAKSHHRNTHFSYQKQWGGIQSVCTRVSPALCPIFLHLHRFTSRGSRHKVRSVLFVSSGEERGQVRAADDELCISYMLKVLFHSVADPSALILDENATQWCTRGGTGRLRGRHTSAPWEPNPAGEGICCELGKPLKHQVYPVLEVWSVGHQS